MACCMSEEAQWCKDLSVVDYKDEERYEYCVFHAPQGHKDISLEEFNKLVFEKINKAKSENKPCNLSLTIFEGDISFQTFNDNNFLPTINFVKAKFSGEANFRDVQFSGVATFWGTQFSGVANFAQAKFSGVPNFVKAKFSGEADFWDAQFNEKAFFLKAKFSGEADFVMAKFSREVNFGDAQFIGEAKFIQANFGGEVNFVKAKFGEGARFMKAEFNDEANFSETQFDGQVDFWKALFRGQVDFDTTIFNNVAQFINLSIIKKIKFEKVNLGKCSFIDTDMRLLDFINCEWPIKVINIIGYNYSRRVLYDELELFKEKDRKEYNNKIIKVGQVYRQMKQKYKVEHNELEVSDWHYGEKEMHRKGTLLRRYFPFSISNLYWATSGYGERSARAGSVLFMLIVSLALLLNLFGIKSTNVDTIDHQIIKGFSGFFDLKAFGLLSLTALQQILFVKAPIYVPLNNYGIFIETLFSKLLIPIQAALLAFSIRNKFRR
jgi:uncharacterized protein YjbI with pentapeptide repeats